MVAVAVAVLLALVLSGSGTSFILAAPPDCGLLQDCYMNGFYGNTGAGSGAWKLFKLGGIAAIDLAPIEGWPSGPSVHFHGADNQFDAGIYQQVTNAVPGTGYHVQAYWAVEQVDGKGYQSWYQVDRRLGVDPLGGTDPNSPNVQWSADYYANGKFDLQFDAYAKSPNLTVFVRVTNPYTDHVVDVYIDTVTLTVNSTMPPQAVTAPTATSAPPPPTNPPPTARPTRVPTEVAAVEPTATDQPTDTPAPSVTAAPTDTAEPSDTPTRLPTRGRRATPTPAPAVAATSDTNPLLIGVIAIAGLGGVVVAGIFFALAFVFWRRARR